MITTSARQELRFVGFRNHTGMDDRTLRKAERRGDLVRVWRGAFVPREIWASLTAEEQHRLVILAAIEATRTELVVSHRSAAVLWGIPTLQGAAPPPVHVLTPVANGSRTEHGFAKHASARLDDGIVVEHGIAVTSIERTVVELALTRPFGEAVVAADWALANSASRDDLTGALDALDPVSRRRRAELVIAFADPAAGSPGESLSRALIHELGFPAPQLQVRFDDRRGFIGVVDFYWPQVPLIGEFDGAVKYMLRGRTAGQALMDEKRREDRLRGLGPGVARWVWSDLTRARLGGLLTEAGLRR